MRIRHKVGWHPCVTVQAGSEAALVLHHRGQDPTSAYGGYSACRQYDEDIVRALQAVPDGPELVKLRQFFDHPLFIGAFALGEASL